MTPEADDWLGSGRATRLPRELSDALDAHMKTLPWGGSRVDFSRLAVVEELNLDEASDDDVADWLARTHLGRHGHVALFLPGEDCTLVAEMRDVIRHLDDLYVSIEATYLFAVDLRDGQFVPAFDDFMEYRGGVLTAPTAQPLWPRVNEHTAPARVSWAEAPPQGVEYLGVTSFGDPRGAIRARWFHVVLSFLGSREKVEVGVLAHDVPRHVLEPGFAFELRDGQRKIADVVIDGRPSARPGDVWVWVFMRDKATFPSGVFNDIGPAHAWIREHGLSGRLSRVAMNTGSLARFVTAEQESYEYQDGICFDLDG